MYENEGRSAAAVTSESPTATNALTGANIPTTTSHSIDKSRKTTTPHAATRKNARIGAIDTHHHVLKQGWFDSRTALTKRKTRNWTS